MTIENNPQNIEERDRYKLLAKAQLTALNAQTRAALISACMQDSQANIFNLVSEEPKYVYHCRLDMGGFLYLHFDLFFGPWDWRNDFRVKFTGNGGGLFVAGGVTWGTAWLNMPIEDLMGTDANFNLNAFAQGVNINLTKKDGTPIGSIATGGIGLGAGVSGGAGNFWPA